MSQNLETICCRFFQIKKLLCRPTRASDGWEKYRVAYMISEKEEKLLLHDSQFCVARNKYACKRGPTLHYERKQLSCSDRHGNRNMWDYTFSVSAVNCIHLNLIEFTSVPMYTCPVWQVKSHFKRVSRQCRLYAILLFAPTPFSFISVSWATANMFSLCWPTKFRAPSRDHNLTPHCMKAENYLCEILLNDFSPSNPRSTTWSSLIPQGLVRGDPRGALVALVLWSASNTSEEEQSTFSESCIDRYHRCSLLLTRLHTESEYR